MIKNFVTFDLDDQVACEVVACRYAFFTLFTRTLQFPSTHLKMVFSHGLLQEKLPRKANLARHIITHHNPSSNIRFRNPRPCLAPGVMVAEVQGPLLSLILGDVRFLLEDLAVMT